ncbi:Death on curing protein, Doc toxin [hydrothermal vent metagenome]|uniref:Death on curing protein, Doc toxin n=1 Tax=hydrothermal vent metagenome TaxID=652676 RepID=A0A3B1AQ65_9ZZZZ
MKIIWSPLAVDQIAAIAEYITLDNPVAAEKWVDDIFNSVKRLKKFPKSGRIIPEIQLDNFREIIFGNYRIIYRIDKNQISVLTVRNGSQILPVNEILA